MSKSNKNWLIIVFVLPFLLWATYRSVASIVFEVNCSGYLKRAADANTVELAKRELGKAISYIEENNLTLGFTSVVYKTPSEDVGFWYENLKSSFAELDKVHESTTQLERTNILLKLRETLIDQHADNTRVTVPFGISVFPNNFGLAMFGLLSFLVASVYSGCRMIDSIP